MINKKGVAVSIGVVALIVLVGFTTFFAVKAHQEEPFESFQDAIDKTITEITDISDEIIEEPEDIIFEQEEIEVEEETSIFELKNLTKGYATSGENIYVDEEGIIHLQRGTGGNQAFYADEINYTSAIIEYEIKGKDFRVDTILRGQGRKFCSAGECFYTQPYFHQIVHNYQYVDARFGKTTQINIGTKWSNWGTMKGSGGSGHGRENSGETVDLDINDEEWHKVKIELIDNTVNMHIDDTQVIKDASFDKESMFYISEGFFGMQISLGSVEIKDLRVTKK